MRSLWQSREQALAVLAEKVPEGIAVLNEFFEIVDECAESLHRIDSPFGRVAAITIVKARNLALGCYSLTLDSLAQEGGALLRPLVEAVELLTYFRLDPCRVERSLDASLPKAGKIAKCIEGKFRDLREHLNNHASHLSLEPEAFGHLVDWKSLELQTQQPFQLPVVLKNLHLLFAVFCFVAVESVNCVTVARDEVQHDLANGVEAMKSRGLRIFEGAVRRAST